MLIFYHILKKEFLIIKRDFYSLAILFIMPVLFILMMSLAMRDLFEMHSKVKINIIIINQDSGEISSKFLDILKETDNFSIHFSDKDIKTDRIISRMYKNDYKFSFIIQDNFTSFFNNQDDVKSEKKPVLLLVNPTVNSQLYEIVENIILNALVRIKLDIFLSNFEEFLAYEGTDKNLIAEPPSDLIETKYVYKGSEKFTVPSSVQQSVPAWLVLSMYFIVIPISNTFITERNHGTLIRLQSMNLPKGYILFSKILPYFLVNQIQFGLMIAVGVFIVPLFGGDALPVADSSYSGLLLISGSVSFSAISLALFIASVSKTTEQAATTGGVLNLILGAMGGVMVPKFVMPNFMQEMANFSPLSWGLEGFLDVFLRKGNIADLLYESSLLISFGLMMLILTFFIIKRKFSRY